MPAAINAASGSFNEATSWIPILADEAPLWLKHFRHTFRILRATLREIFDESAYERFLTRTQTTRSIASYRAFLRERETVVARKPRCC